jgi:CRISPR-associated RAMP protein (TIGR02581 family)
MEGADMSEQKQILHCTDTLKPLDVLQQRTIITGTLQCKTGLRIGSAKDSSGVRSDLPVLRDANQLPYIPGSSFKGVLRSTVEALVRATHLDPQRTWKVNEAPPSLWCCNPLEDAAGKEKEEVRGFDEACLSRRWRKKLLAYGPHRDPRNPEELKLEVVLSHSCTVCQIFGNCEMASRAFIADMALSNSDGLPHPVEQRDGVAIDRDLLTARAKAKFDFEVVPAGARFDFEIILDNATRLHHGLIVAGLSAISEGHARIGGFGSRGLGRVAIVNTACTQQTAKDILTGIKARPLEWKDVEEMGQKALQQQMKESCHA